MTIRSARSGINALTDLVGAERASTTQVFRARAHATPDSPFLRWRDRLWTYGEAWTVIRRWAGFYRALGTPTDRPRIAGYLTNRPEAVWAWLGAQAAGATYVALNRDHVGDLLADHLTRSRAGILVTESAALDKLPMPGTTGVETTVVVDADQIPGTVPGLQASTHPPWNGPDPDPGSVATVMFTSGTTGRSKAALLPHNQFCRGAAHLAAAVELTSEDVLHGWPPLFHIAGQLHIVMTAALAGASVGLVPGFRASRFWEEVDQVQATGILGLPATARILWDRPVTSAERSAIQRLRLGIFGPMTPELHRPLEERLGITIIDTYGMTEAEPLTVPIPEVRSPVGSCGVPGPDFDLLITDHWGNPVPGGTAGEIRIRPRAPDVMFHGYEGDPKATEACWRDLWFLTGDLAHQDEDGFVYYVDRRTNFIRRRGENISAWELQRLVEGHPGVREAFALPVPSALGEDDVKVVVVPATGSALDPGELHRWCGAHMARFMVPTYIEVLEDIPHLSVGKVDRAALGGVGPGVWQVAPEDGETV